MTHETLKPHNNDTETLTDKIIEYTVSIANEFLVPKKLDAKLWNQLEGNERFYLHILDVESMDEKKLNNYQNFAKTFKMKNYQPLMASMKPNDAHLKSTSKFKRTKFNGSEFANSTLRTMLYALHKLQHKIKPNNTFS